jgi:hypothetical protein
MGHLLKIKCVDSMVNVDILASTSVPFTLTTVQVPNLALTSVHMSVGTGSQYIMFCFGNNSFIYGNTKMGTRHIYWILIGTSFAVCYKSPASDLC